MKKQKRQKALIQCSYCGALQIKRFFWNKWINYGIPVIRNKEANVSHGICPVCFKIEIEKKNEGG